MTWLTKYCKSHFKSEPWSISNLIFGFLAYYFILFFKRLMYYLFWERGEGREKERERNINVWLPLVHPLLGTWPATQACALTGNQTSDSLVCRPVLNPLSHTSQGNFLHFLFTILFILTLNFIISLFLLALGFVYSFFSFWKYTVRLLIWGLS